MGDGLSVGCAIARQYRAAGYFKQVLLGYGRAVSAVADSCCAPSCHCVDGTALYILNTAASLVSTAYAGAAAAVVRAGGSIRIDGTARNLDSTASTAAVASADARTAA